MDNNTLFQSLDRKHVLTDDAKTLAQSLDMIVSAIVGRLIAERLIDYAQQPGQTIEYLATVVADEAIKSLRICDSVEMKRFYGWTNVQPAKRGDNENA